jgi:hypothetical protein
MSKAEIVEEPLDLAREQIERMPAGNGLLLTSGDVRRFLSHNTSCQLL